MIEIFNISFSFETLRVNISHKEMCVFVTDDR